MKKITLILSLMAIAGLLAFAAAADGTWSIAGSVPTAPQQISLTTSASGLTGTMDGAPISNGNIQGNTVWFSATRGGVTYKYKGTVTGTKLALFEEPPSGQGRLLNYNHN